MIAPNSLSNGICRTIDPVKKALLLVVFGFLSLPGWASHIVGGEFELIYRFGNTYRLNLVLYFDQLNGQPGAKDLQVNAQIFRKSDNKLIRFVALPLIKESQVNYTQPSCSHGEIVTSKLLYSDSLLVLGPDLYADPGGYYVVWQRCCRNYQISNIYSLDPQFNPAFYAGQTFYLEFPSVVKDGQPFIDSTPRLFPPLNDYACPYRPYYTDFGGIDDDGDSLVYSLVPPLNTKVSEAIPPASPLPYPNVTYRPPYSATNILNGAPDLRITQSGFLTVTPTVQGLFVFAVKVEEYRNKLKIGETRRDFQMLVVDACPVAVPPKIQGKKLTDVSYSNASSLNVFFNSATADADRCVNVRVSDADSQSISDNFQERVKIKAFALNFKGDVTTVLPAITEATLTNGSTAEFTVCFPQCPYLFGGTPEIAIIAMDDACSLPLTDTLKIAVDVQPPPNNKPRFTSPNPVNATLNEGDQQAWPWSVVDDDGDPLVISVLTNGFSLAGAGMQFKTLTQTNGAASGEVKWDAYCDIYDFTKRTAFQVTVQVEDQDQCKIPDPTKGIYNLNVILPGNADPIIDSDLTANPLERTVDIVRRLDDALDFNVIGTDLVDNDLLVLSARGGPLDTSLPGVTIAASPTTNRGTVSTHAAWTIACKDVDLTVKEEELYQFQFIVVDNANKCRIYKADTLDVNLTVKRPINHAPVLSVINNNPGGTTLAGDILTLTRGAPIDLTLTGTDADLTPQKDMLKLQLADQKGNVNPKGYQFMYAEGRTPVQSSFNWTPDCSIFRNGSSEKEYQLSFELLDDRCQTAKKDSLRLTIKVKDIDGSDDKFFPPNFVSPNGDDKNDYYAMERLIPETGEKENILPLDNCQGSFEYVLIYNRWGKELFRSTDRDFRWYPGDTPAGTYYYSIKFTNKEYKGPLTVMY